MDTSPTSTEGGWAAVADDWAALANRSGCSPFLDPVWQQALAETSPVETLPTWLTLEGGQPTMAMLGKGPGRRRSLFRARTLWLNESGDPQLCQLLPEHNAPLCPAGGELQALRRLIVHLLEDRRDWDEFSLGWMDAHLAERLPRHLNDLPVRMHEAGRTPYYYVDLSAYTDLDDYLASRSRNTRQQLRRSMRAYGGRGALETSIASSPEQHRTWFRDLCRLHKAQWHRRGHPGAFSAARVTDFHRVLLERAAGTGLVEFMRIQTAEATVGYLYNLRSGSVVYNYQNGFAYWTGNRYRPGLICHALAIEHGIAAGTRRYDLLMGDSQYKRSLASDCGEMVWLLVQRPRLRFAAERLGRRLLAPWRSARRHPSVTGRSHS